MTHNVPYLSHEHPLRLAHRGSRVLWPENTLTAFQGAVDHGCIYIETDLHVTKDRKIVIFHDDTLERVTNGSGEIKDWNWQDLQKLDAAYHFKPEEDYPLRGKGIGIPSLEEVMATFSRVNFNLDLKQQGIEETVAECINRHGYHDRVLIASFHGVRTRRCRRLLKHPTATSAGALKVLWCWTGSRFGLAFKPGAATFQVPVRQAGLTILDQKFIDSAHGTGVQVHAWTIDDPGEMKRLLDMGIDGIVTDRIDLLNETLAF
jgi:glycerophosphoryl diester phosphodiesterase